MKNKQHLILLRGLPGAGKTTFAKLIAENKCYPIYSVDDYFTDALGNYQFKFEENYKAYAACLSHVEQAIEHGHLKIIVHNTFTLDWEIEPYFKLAKKHHIEIHILTVENYHNKQNVHDVSDAQIKKMAEKYKVKLF